MENLQLKVAIVIPYYNAEKHIKNVLSKIPSYIYKVIIVNDCSPQPLPSALFDVLHENVVYEVIESEVNLGVGGATIKGFRRAWQERIDIVVKVDADNQMDLSFLPELITPLLDNKCQVAKGNRFRDFTALQKMPLVRRMGNLGLSFLTKMATGYWNNFDPTNGYIALNTNLFKELNFNKLSNRYFFETSLLAELYFQKAIIKDVAMPAIYGDEKSSMNVWTMPIIFGSKLFKTFCKRIVKQYFLYDFNIGSLYVFFGLPLFFFGVFFGIYTWIQSAISHELAPTGTIMIITLSIILGFQLLLQAIQYDVIHAPKS
ncbi:glycosyltransferase family 2 protein [Flavobacterium lacisediminis]|uniref:Glycosyltransferase family 2 protein n=1 Tax=Flavobacterium lacisediminis TaxID=2989705 RepID=A0ABT3EJR8_9FLAO|nr:glycosyltransferase family 2 protein [Flavobacterium lacisediminis]MCW1148822.1 glycosyltransferase family 2 protein [Flavobacterium lacisediminis]